MAETGQEDQNQILTIGTITIGQVLVDDISNQDARDEIFASLDIQLPNRPGDHTRKVKVDTGAQANVMPARIYRCIYPDHVDEKGLPIQDKLDRSKTKLSAYNGTEIHQFGLVSFPCRYKENWVETDFYVVDTNSPAILGLSSSRQ